MLTLSKFLIQSPEDLDNRQSSGSDRIGEISTRRRHSTNDRNGTLAVRRSQALNTSGTFVESGQTSSQIGGVTGIGRHLSQTTGDLTEGLGPTRGRVSHHGHVHALITEVFSKGNTGVNGGLTGGHRHVGCIGNQSGTLHDTDFTLRSIGIRNSHGKFREIRQNFSHLVTTFTATDVNNSIRVGKLGKGLTNDGLSATEGTGDGAGSSKDRRKQSVNDTKTSDKGFFSGKLLGDRTRTTDGPEVAEGQLVGLVLGFVVNFHDNIVDKETFVSIGSGSVNLGNGTVDIRRTQNLVRIDNFVLVDSSDNVSSSNGLSLLECSRSESPTGLASQTRDIHTLGDVYITACLPNVFEGTLDTIENTSHDTGTKFDGKRLLLSEDGITNGQTRGILVNLNGGSVSFELNDFSDELLVTNTHEFVHSSTTHTLGDNQRTRHLKDVSIVGFLFFVSVKTHDDKL
mmetsp:Transcript_12503/g.31473  ORF Transcript_12503/g.31473 Transcript_12503/m.31473 type:complete len:456 (+) Transcript_12503:618-1985(+)